MGNTCISWSVFWCGKSPGRCNIWGSEVFWADGGMRNNRSLSSPRLQSHWPSDVTILELWNLLKVFNFEGWLGQSVVVNLDQFQSSTTVSATHPPLPRPVTGILAHISRAACTTGPKELVFQILESWNDLQGLKRPVPSCCCEFAQSCPTLCDPMDYSLTHSSIHGIFQARVLEWVAISFSRGSSWPRDRTQVSCIVGRCFTVWASREVVVLIPDKTTRQITRQIDTW